MCVFSFLKFQFQFSFSYLVGWVFVHFNFHVCFVSNLILKKYVQRSDCHFNSLKIRKNEIFFEKIRFDLIFIEINLIFNPIFIWKNQILIWFSIRFSLRKSDVQKIVQSVFELILCKKFFLKNIFDFLSVFFWRSFQPKLSGFHNFHTIDIRHVSWASKFC